MASKVFGGLGWLAANVGADNIIASCQDCESQVEYTPSDPQEPSVVFQILQGIAQWVVMMVTIAIVAGGLKCLFLLSKITRRFITFGQNDGVKFFFQHARTTLFLVLRNHSLSQIIISSITVYKNENSDASTSVVSKGLRLQGFM